jgi:prephenate dehydrogenase
MPVNPARPRVAIVGGGGAMGRLLARLFRPATRELYLVDYFGSGIRPANLGLAIDELRSADPGAGWETAGIVKARVGEDSAHPDIDQAWQLTAFDPRGQRALAVSPPDDVVRPHADLLSPGVGTLGELLERRPLDRDGRTLVVACQPSDASELIPRADVVVLALGFESRSGFVEAVQPYARWIKPGGLVVDLGSTKTQPLAVLTDVLPPGVDVLGAHPLFGPSVADLTGLTVALAEPMVRRSGSPWRGWLLDQLARHRILVTRTTAVEHDDAMGFVQALAHVALLAFAYTFVRLDRDPADLLPFRTPIFEPLLYLAARVAYLASSSPDTYRSIQAFSTRPDARQAFLESAREMIAAIDALPNADDASRPRDRDPLSELFRRYGAPWSPDGRERRDRQRHEQLVDMGGRLVDGLNRVRQEVVASVGQVRAIEERRAGQSPRVVVGVVDVDLRDPRKHDVGSQIRLRPLNLALGSVKGEGIATGAAGETGHDQIIPVARARLLGDAEMYEWLYATHQLVEKRSFTLMIPSWFDRDVLYKLLRGMTPDARIGQMWDVDLEAQRGEGVSPAFALATVTLAIVLHPAGIVAIRQRALDEIQGRSGHELATIEGALDDLRDRLERVTDVDELALLDRQKDTLKHRRKALIDRRTGEVDRTVRRETRARVNEIADVAVTYLLAHGCSRTPSPTGKAREI